MTKWYVEGSYASVWGAEEKADTLTNNGIPAQGLLIIGAEEEESRYTYKPVDANDPIDLIDDNQVANYAGELAEGRFLLLVEAEYEGLVVDAIDANDN